MDIATIRRKRDALEAAIAEAIRDFEDECMLEVRSIDLEHVSELTGASQVGFRLSTVEVEVVL